MKNILSYFLFIPMKNLFFMGVIFFLFSCSSEINYNTKWIGDQNLNYSIYPIFHDDLIITLEKENQEYCLKAQKVEDGTPMWKICDQPDFKSIYYNADIPRHDNWMFLPISNKLFCIDMRNGKINWSTQYFTNAEQSIELVEEKLIQTYYDDENYKAHVLSIDIYTGKSSIIFTTEIPANKIFNFKTPTIEQENNCIANCIFSIYDAERLKIDNTFIKYNFCSQKGDTTIINLPISESYGFSNKIVSTENTNLLFLGRYIYAFDKSSNKTKWEKKLESDMVSSRPHIYDGSLYFAAENKRLYTLDLETGNVTWELEIGGTPSRIVQIDKKTIALIGGSDGKLYTIDIKNQHSKTLLPEDFGLDSEDGFNRLISANNRKLALITQRNISVSQVY